MSPELDYVVIDFSEAHEIGSAQEGQESDMANLGQHIRAFADAIRGRDVITRQDERVLTAVGHLAGTLNGGPPGSLGILQARDVYERFVEALASTAAPPRRLADPFRALSAEFIPSDALLADLCFTQLWWRPELEKEGNVLLIGPRGSGKTMIFRRLRLKTKIAAKKLGEIDRDDYVAFYLPCESLFYMRFSDLAQVADKHVDALVLFFNMAALAEVSGTIALLPESLLASPIHVTVALTDLAREEVGGLWQELALPDTVTDPQELVDCAEALMRRVRRSIAYDQATDVVGSSDFVSRQVCLLREKVPLFAAKHFIFFLDDYTDGRVPIALQQALSPIVSQRSPDISFKMSAHMFGSIYHHPHYPPADDARRNVEVVNLSSAYLTRETRAKQETLLLDIINKRLRGYKGRIEDWLGKTVYETGRTLSRSLHDKDTRRRTWYHGTSCLMDLCTGDYSEMIRMVGEIFRSAGIDRKSPLQKIAAKVQHDAIVRVSRDFLGRIRHIRPDGETLYAVAKSFGELSSRLLVNHRLVSQGTGRREPYEWLTIYVENRTRATRQTQDVWQRLQQMSIFVDSGIASSQRAVVADRATLRRIYCPAFRTTLTDSEHPPLSKEDFEYLMLDPEEWCRGYYRKAVKTPEQAPLIEEPTQQIEMQEEEEDLPTYFPQENDVVDFASEAPADWLHAVSALPALVPAKEAIAHGSKYAVYLGALGFEERTSAAVEAAVARDATAETAVLLEFDVHVDANEQQRARYESALRKLTPGKAHRPLSSSVSVPNPSFPAHLRGRLSTEGIPPMPRVLFDCTSCPSAILAQTLAVLLDYPCDLTVLYSEADLYYPSRSDWGSGLVRHLDSRLEGPFRGVQYVTSPPILGSDDNSGRPLMLVLFPTFNTERTDGVISDVVPAGRIWLFGEPHDMDSNGYRVEMEKTFAARIITPGDPWQMVPTFDFRASLQVLGGIYAKYRDTHRITVMPHGSKMQTLAATLFRSAHDTSMVFAMPKEYDANRYSKGCAQVWALPLGPTDALAAALRDARVVGER